jgi:hypothetical protein
MLLSFQFSMLEGLPNTVRTGRLVLIAVPDGHTLNPAFASGLTNIAARLGTLLKHDCLFRNFRADYI